jgi:hypothetical protein
VAKKVNSSHVSKCRVFCSGFKSVIINIKAFTLLVIKAFALLAEEAFALLVIKALIKKFEGLPKKFKGSGAVQGGRFKFLLYTIPKIKRFCCIIKEVICEKILPHMT